MSLKVPLYGQPAYEHDRPYPTADVRWDPEKFGLGKAARHTNPVVWTPPDSVSPISPKNGLESPSSSTKSSPPSSNVSLAPAENKLEDVSKTPVSRPIDFPTGVFRGANAIGLLPWTMTQRTPSPTPSAEIVEIDPSAEDDVTSERSSSPEQPSMESLASVGEDHSSYTSVGSNDSEAQLRYSDFIQSVCCISNDSFASFRMEELSKGKIANRMD